MFNVLPLLNCVILGQGLTVLAVHVGAGGSGLAMLSLIPLFFLPFYGCKVRLN